MQSLRFVFLIVALVLFALGAIWSPPAPPRVNLLSAGAFFTVLALVVGP